MVANSEKQRAGDLARAREFLTKIDSILGVTADVNCFSTVDPQSINAVVNPLLIARIAICNLMLDLGDGYNACGMILDAPPQPHRDRNNPG